MPAQRLLLSVPILSPLRPPFCLFHEAAQMHLYRIAESPGLIYWSLHQNRGFCLGVPHKRGFGLIPPYSPHTLFYSFPVFYRIYLSVCLACTRNRFHLVRSTTPEVIPHGEHFFLFSLLACFLPSLFFSTLDFGVEVSHTASTYTHSPFPFFLRFHITVHIPLTSFLLHTRTFRFIIIPLYFFFTLSRYIHKLPFFHGLFALGFMRPTSAINVRKSLAHIVPAHGCNINTLYRAPPFRGRPLWSVYMKATHFNWSFAPEVIHFDVRDVFGIRGCYTPIINDQSCWFISSFSTIFNSTIEMHRLNKPNSFFNNGYFNL